MRPSWIFGCFFLTSTLVGLGGVIARFSQPPSLSTAVSTVQPGAAQTAPSPTNSGSNPSATSAVYRIPIVKRTSQIPVVNATFNGKTYPMLFDTGASLTVITSSMAQDLMFEHESYVVATTGTGQRVRVPFGRVKSMQIGGVQLNDFEVAVGNVPLLGQNFLNRFTVVIGRDEVLLQPHATLENQQTPVVSAPTIVPSPPSPQVLGAPNSDNSNDTQRSYLDNLP